VGQRGMGGGRAYQCLVGAGGTLEKVTVQEQRAGGMMVLHPVIPVLTTNSVVSSIKRGADGAKNQGGNEGQGEANMLQQGP